MLSAKCHAFCPDLNVSLTSQYSCIWRSETETSGMFSNLYLNFGACKLKLVYLQYCIKHTGAHCNIGRIRHLLLRSRKVPKVRDLCFRVFWLLYNMAFQDLTIIRSCDTEMSHDTDFCPYTLVLSQEVHCKLEIGSPWDMHYGLPLWLCTAPQGVCLLLPVD